LIKEISTAQALTFNFQDEWHKDFYKWKKHLLIAGKVWPQLKKFYNSPEQWLGHFGHSGLEAVYFYTIKDGEMYDGFLESWKIGAGIKLGRYLPEYTKDLWTTNWSMCNRKHLDFNSRLGYTVEGMNQLTPDYKGYLLCRKK
jgi:hypothetical protein|tara:strand:+ start:964 stop:1389 length:426 start_codon:yes stop_codon:yes gene_type:complete